MSKKVVLRIRDKKPKEETEVLDVWLEKDGNDWIRLYINGCWLIALKPNEYLNRNYNCSDIFPAESSGQVAVVP